MNLAPSLSVAALFLIACGGAPNPAVPSTTTGGNAPKQEPKKEKSPVCHEVHEMCEPFEDKGGVAQGCHDMTYSATEEQCVAKKAECLAACAKK